MLLYCFLYFIIGINTTTVNNNFLVTAYVRYFTIESYVILYYKLYKYVLILTNLTYYTCTCIRTIFYFLWWRRFLKNYIIIQNEYVMNWNRYYYFLCELMCTSRLYKHTINNALLGTVHTHYGIFTSQME